MDKLDLTKTYKSYFSAAKKPEIVDIPRANFISITGKGDPSAKPFAENIEALYTVAYTIKFAHKKENRDFVVSKLEGLWWFDEKLFPNKSIADTIGSVPRAEWQYRLLIRQPEFVSEQDVAQAIQIALDKKGLPLLQRIAFYSMTEGPSVQMLHVGPFSTEQETLLTMTDYMQANGLIRNGHHHEIYLSDFRKTAPEKLKTILREPFKK